MHGEHRVDDNLKLAGVLLLKTVHRQGDLPGKVGEVLREGEFCLKRSNAKEVVIREKRAFWLGARRAISRSGHLGLAAAAKPSSQIFRDPYFELKRSTS